MLVTELAYPEYRAQLTSLYNSLWYSGSIVWADCYAFRLVYIDGSSVLPGLHTVHSRLTVLGHGVSHLCYKESRPYCSVHLSYFLPSLHVGWLAREKMPKHFGYWPTTMLMVMSKYISYAHGIYPMCAKAGSPCAARIRGNKDCNRIWPHRCALSAIIMIFFHSWSFLSCWQCRVEVPHRYPRQS